MRKTVDFPSENVWLHCGLAIFFVFAIFSIASALEAGRAQGSLTIGGQTVSLNYAYALKYVNNPVFHVLLSEKPIPEEALKDREKLIEKCREGEVKGLLLRILDWSSIYQLEIMNSKDPAGIMPKADWTFAPGPISKTLVEGQSSTSEPVKVQTSRYQYKVAFKANLGEGAYGRNPAASADLKKNPPKEKEKEKEQEKEKD